MVNTGETKINRVAFFVENNEIQPATKAIIAIPSTQIVNPNGLEKNLPRLSSIQIISKLDDGKAP